MYWGSLANLLSADRTRALKYFEALKVFSLFDDNVFLPVGNCTGNALDSVSLS